MLNGNVISNLQEYLNIATDVDVIDDDWFLTKA